MKFLSSLLCALLISSSSFGKGDLSHVWDESWKTRYSQIFKDTFDSQEFQTHLMHTRQSSAPLTLGDFVDANKLKLHESSLLLTHQQNEIKTPASFGRTRKLTGLDKTYTIGEVPGDGDCLFSAASTTRRDFVRFLSQNASMHCVKDYLTQAIRDDLGKGELAFERDAPGKKAVALFKDITQLDQFSTDFTDAHRHLYIDTVIAQNPLMDSPRYSLAERSLINLLALHIGKSISIVSLEGGEDLLALEGAANIMGVDLPETDDFQTKYNLILERLIQRGLARPDAIQMLVGMGLNPQKRLVPIVKSQTEFSHSISIVQVGPHFERLLTDPEVSPYQKTELPYIRTRFKEALVLTKTIKELLKKRDALEALPQDKKSDKDIWLWMREK